MTFSELIAFIDQENKRLVRYYHDKKTDPEKLVLFRTVKLGEEFGELCDEILALSKSQRQEKMKERDNLGNEFADVLFTTLLLARMLKVDVTKAIKQKMKKVDARYGKK